MARLNTTRYQGGYISKSNRSHYSKRKPKPTTRKYPRKYSSKRSTIKKSNKPISANT